MSTTTKLIAVRGMPALPAAGPAHAAADGERPWTFAELRAHMQADQRREAGMRSDGAPSPRDLPSHAADAEDTRTPTVFFTAVDIDPVLPARWRVVLWLSALCPVAAVGWSVLAYAEALSPQRVGRPPWPAMHAAPSAPWGPVALCAAGALAVLVLHVGMAARLRRPVRVPAVMILVAVMVVGILDGMRP